MWFYQALWVIGLQYFLKFLSFACYHSRAIYQAVRLVANRIVFIHSILRVVIMKFEAIVREVKGKGASRRLRHENKFPAIVYGGKGEPVSVILDHNAVIHQMDKPEFYEAITLVIDGKDVKVKPQDIQRHPFKPKVMHMDFIRL